MHEILENELPLKVRVNNYLLTGDYFKLSMLLDIPPGKAMDFCRELRALATNISEQIKLYPEKREDLRATLDRYRLRKIEECFAEAQKHE